MNEKRNKLKKKFKKCDQNFYLKKKKGQGQKKGWGLDFI